MKKMSIIVEGILRQEISYYAGKHQPIKDFYLVEENDLYKKELLEKFLLPFCGKKIKIVIEGPDEV